MPPFFALSTNLLFALVLFTPDLFGAFLAAQAKK